MTEFVLCYKELVGTALAAKGGKQEGKQPLLQKLVVGVLVPLWAGSLSKVIPDAKVCVSLQQVNRTAHQRLHPKSQDGEVFWNRESYTMDRDAFWHTASHTPSILLAGPGEGLCQHGEEQEEGESLEGSSAR